jgi:hypothetical protein
MHYVWCYTSFQIRTLKYATFQGVLGICHDAVQGVNNLVTVVLQPWVTWEIRDYDLALVLD